MLTTRNKLLIAKCASVGLRGLRRAVGRGPEVSVTRGGIHWGLDLREGIDLAIYLGRYQTIPPRLLKAIAAKPGCTAVDIGANIGAFALPLAKAVGEGGHVIACEATDYAFGKLTHNLMLNPGLSERILPIQALLGDGTQDEVTADPAASAMIYSSWRVDGDGAEDHPLHGGRPMPTANAQIVAFDQLASANAAIARKLECLEVIKLDVDGHELPILRGARDTIAASRPKLLIEIAPHVQDERDGGLQALIDELEFQGFRLHDPLSGEPVSHMPADLRQNIAHGAGVDYLGIID
jgi:FkbM family methyltransferase